VGLTRRVKRIGLPDKPVLNAVEGSGDYIIKELLDAPPFCGTYSKSKELLFLSPCSRQASLAPLELAIEFYVQ
jgi:hypothetical protein